MKHLPHVLIAAAGCWALSEILELTLGGRTSITLWLTAAFHLLMAFGIWGAWAGQSGGSSRLSLAGAGLASVGFLILVYPPVAVSRMLGTTLPEFMAAHPVFQLAGLLAVVGTILFGIAVLRYRSYPAWTGLALMVCPAVFTASLALEWPDPVGITANLIESAALIVIGWRALVTVALPVTENAVSPP